MSKIPKIPSLAAPKTLSKNNAVNSAAHDKLLRATWGFVKNIAHGMFFDSDNPAVKNAKKIYLNQVAIEIYKAEQRMVSFPEKKDFWNDIIQNLQLAKNTPIPAPPAEVNALIIKNQHLSAPIKNNNFQNQTIIGYIDMEISVSVPEAYLSSDQLYAISNIYDEDDMIELHGESISTKQKETNFEPPQWEQHDHLCTIWIDVRPTLGPIGQLIRELKTLGEYAAPTTRIVVITDDNDPQAQKMLANEGFLLFTLQEIQNIEYPAWQVKP